MTPRLVQAACPRCGASLPIAQGATQVACAYCGTTVFVQPPKRATGVFTPPPVGQPTVQLDANQWTQLGGAIAAGTIGMTVITLIIVAITIAGAVVATVVSIKSPPVPRPPKSISKPPNEGLPDPLATADESTTSVTYDFPTLESCQCRVKVGQKQGFVTLSATISGPSDVALVGKYVLHGLDDVDVALPVTDRTSPPRAVHGRLLGLALACDADVVAIANGGVVSGWSAKKPKLLWSTKLPGAYIFPAKAPKDGFSIDCAHGEGDVVGFPTEAGDVRIRIADGSIVK
jgi:ribosomal protein S27AE